MKKKAIAYQEYNEAAMIDMLMKSLPQVTIASKFSQLVQTL